MTNRRDFLKTTAIAGFGFWVAGTARAADEKEKSSNEKIRFACIGIGGKGGSDTADAARFGDVVAVCDIDDHTLGGAGKAFPDAKKYSDFRKLFDEMANSIDAVTVSTADHTHAAASIMAMKLGKHCFCQKPLTHTLYEARRMGEVARQMKVATQMGNQGTAHDGLRKGAALLKAGVLGKVTEVHVWTNRPIWPQGIPRQPEAPAPGHVHWDAWLGPAAERPYAVFPKDYPQKKYRGQSPYHPFAWRGWWDFGTGALGDMACHTMNMPFMGLDLREPTSVEAQCSENNKDSYPNWSIIRYTFPERGERPALTLTWYDGGKRPSAEIAGIERVPGSGCVIIGEKGKLFTPDDYGAQYKLLGGASEVKVEFPRARNQDHFAEFVRAIKGGPPAMSNFPDYAGPLTETVLLGNLAVWAGKKVEWDARNLKATNAPEVEEIIRPQYRRGWTL
jgi:predicted dehydrogenase